MSESTGESPGREDGASHDEVQDVLIDIYTERFEVLTVVACKWLRFDDAQDVVADVLYRLLYEKDPPLQVSGREAIEGEVKRLVEHKARTRRAQNDRQASILFQLRSGDALIDAHTRSHPEAVVLRGERKQLSEAAIAALPPRRREIYLMSIDEELTPSQIAERLRLKVESVRVARRAARTRVIEQLVRGGYDEEQRRTRRMSGETGDDAGEDA